MFMRDFDKVFEKLRETSSAEEINELKEYFLTKLLVNQNIYSYKDWTRKIL